MKDLDVCKVLKELKGQLEDEGVPAELVKRVDDLAQCAENNEALSLESVACFRIDLRGAGYTSDALDDIFNALVLIEAEALIDKDEENEHQEELKQLLGLESS